MNERLGFEPSVDNSGLSEAMKTHDMQAIKAAFTREQQKHQDGIRHKVTALVGRPEIADEITNQAFTKAFTSLDKFDPARSFFSWVMHIAQNLAIDSLRRKSSHIASLDSLQEETRFEPAADADDPLAMRYRQELRQQLEEAMSHLPESHRRTIELLDFQGLSREEAAEALGTNLRTLDTWYHRGKGALRKWLEGEQEPKAAK